MEKFAIWLLNELDRQGWQQSEFAREAKITTGTLSNILNGNRKAGWDVCASIAGVLKIPPNEVFRRAGLLPEKNRPDNPEYEALKEVASNLDEDELANALEYARWRYQVQRQKEKSAGD
jgi:transcriptional regulator with XRE-family HTH domain